MGENDRVICRGRIVMHTLGERMVKQGVMGNGVWKRKYECILKRILIHFEENTWEMEYGSALKYFGRTMKFEAV